MDDCILKLGDIAKEIPFGYLNNLYVYLSILSDGPCLLSMGLWHFFAHPNPLILHLLHNFPSFLIVKLIQLIVLKSPPLRLFFLSLLLLLHNNFISNHLLHNDIVKDVAKKFILHCFESN